MHRDTDALEGRIKQLELELASANAERAKYKTLFEVSGDALSIIDLNTGKFIECNDAAVLMHGVESKNNFLNLTPAQISPRFQPSGRASEELATQYIEKTLSEGPQLFQWKHSRLDGTEFPCLVSLTALPVEGQALVLAIGRDISDLEKTKEDLELAKKEAELSNKAKSDFLANMSHEIRTPMNAILGGLQLLRNAELDGDLEVILENASFSAQSLLTVINDILDYSKIESNKLELEHAPFSFNDILESVKYELNEEVSKKGIEFNILVDSVFRDSWLGDLVRVKQILLNLASNAVKFTNKGSVQIKLSEQTYKNQKAICISVVDSGIGMSKAAQQRIFDRFSQADSSTTRKYGGTGLGMSITNSLIELMGGELKLTSEINTGTEVQIILPLEPTLLEKVQKKTKSFKVPNLSDLKILLAEDNEVNQVLIQSILKPSKASVTIVENGELAVNAVKDEVYDLVLMDIHMPQMDGTEAQLLINKLNPELPVIALTANVMADEIKSYLGQGFVAHVGKPIDVNKLYGVLGQFVKL